MKRKRFVRIITLILCIFFLQIISVLNPGIASAEPYVGEIRMFAGNYAPVGWAFCDGQILSISEYETLFNLIGTTYGGDGQETYVLPDLRGRAPIHMGTGSSGTAYIIGETGGVETVTLTVNQIPAHSFGQGSSQAGSSNNPTGNGPAKAVLDRQDINIYSDTTTGKTSSNVPNLGGSQPHDNMQPYLAINYIISLFGVFPSQY